MKTIRGVVVGPSRWTIPKAMLIIPVALGLVFGSPMSALAANVNEETCTASDYTCVNGGAAGNTGYSGSDGPYHYDIDAQGVQIAHNCTSYVAYRIYKVMGRFDGAYNNLGMASDWDTKALGIAGTVFDSTPRVGDVAQWDFGHVAWVDRVQFDLSGNLAWFSVSDDNFNRKVTTRKKIYPGGDSPVIAWPDHFIRFPIFGDGGGGGGLSGGGGHYIAMNLPLLP